MTLTSDYQYIGRSNAVKNQGGNYNYYLLLYAKTSGDTATGKHTVSILTRLACDAQSSFYGYATTGNMSIAGTSVASWVRETIPSAAWSSNLSVGGVNYPLWTDLREGSLTTDVGYGNAKDIQLDATWEFKSSTAESWLPQRNVVASITVLVTLPMIAGASEPSVSASSVEMGGSATIRTNRIAGSGFTHALAYQFGSASGTIAEGVGDSVAWTPPLDLARQIPNNVSGTAVITCTTYANGTPIGSKQVTVVLTVPESVVPSATADWSDQTGANDIMGVFVQGISRLNVTPIGYGSYGSTITGSAVTLDGKPYSGGILTQTGSHTLGISITDSRGRVGTNAYPIRVAAYAAPSLTLNASRCLSNGTADEAGDHAKITVTGFVTQVNDQNKASMKVNWVGSSETVSQVMGNISWQKIVSADVNNTMSISAVLEDKLVAVSRSMVLSTGYATLDLLAGGKGIAFGKAATREGFDCAMPAYFSGGVNGITADQVGAVPAENVQNTTVKNSSIDHLATLAFTVPPNSSTKFRISNNGLLFGRHVGTAYSTAMMYVFGAYSEYRSPAVSQLSTTGASTLSTGGDNTNGWYIEVSNAHSTQGLSLFWIGACYPTFI